MNIMILFTICMVLLVLLLGTWYFILIERLVQEDPELIKVMGGNNYIFELKR